MPKDLVELIAESETYRPKRMRDAWQMAADEDLAWEPGDEGECE